MLTDGDCLAPIMAKQHGATRLSVLSAVLLGLLVASIGGRLPALARASYGALQQAGGLRVSATATVGGTFQVESGTSDPTIEVTDVATGVTQSFPVDPSKSTSIPVPAVPPGSVLIVSVGRGRRARVALIEVLGP